MIATILLTSAVIVAIVALGASVSCAVFHRRYVESLSRFETELMYDSATAGFLFGIAVGLALAAVVVLMLPSSINLAFGV